MRINPYLAFNGNCKEAFTFYAECLRGKIEMMMTHGESPMADQCGPDMRDRIMHVRMTVGDQVLMGSDAPSDMKVEASGFSVSIALADVAEAERIYNELSAGGSIFMPLQQTFWAKRFGMFTDRFGVAWMVNCE